MANLSEIKKDSNWGDTASTLNSNFQNVNVDLEKVKNSTINNKGYFSNPEKLNEAYPSESSRVGMIAYVGTASPYAIYQYTESGWTDTGETYTPEVNLGDYYSKSEVDRMTQQQDDKIVDLEEKVEAQKVKVDTELSESSENPIANSVVAGKITELEQKINSQTVEVDTELNEESQKPIANAPVTKGINKLKEQISTQLPAIEEAKENAIAEIGNKESDAIQNFSEQRVTPGMLSPETIQIINASGGGTINNLPDGETLAEIEMAEGLKAIGIPNRSDVNSMGYVILKKTKLKKGIKYTDLSDNLTFGSYCITGSNVGSSSPMTIVSDGEGKLWCHLITECSAGEKFSIKGEGGSQPRFYCFIDSENNILSVAEISQKGNLIITAPSNSSKLIFNSKINSSPYIKKIETNNDSELYYTISQEDFTQENTIYEIRYNYTLDGGTITIPKGCELKFEGGSLNYGMLIGNDTKVSSNLNMIFGELIFGGTFNIPFVYAEWFGAKSIVKKQTETNQIVYWDLPSEISATPDSSEAFNAALDFCGKYNSGCVKATGAIYKVENTITIPAETSLITEESTIFAVYMQGDGKTIVTHDTEDTKKLTKETLNENAYVLAPNQMIDTSSMAVAFHLTSRRTKFSGRGTITIANCRYTIGVLITGEQYDGLDMSFRSPYFDMRTLGGTWGANGIDVGTEIVSENPSDSEINSSKETIYKWNKLTKHRFSKANGSSTWKDDGVFNNLFNTSVRIDIGKPNQSLDYRLINPYLILGDMWGFRGLEIYVHDKGWFNISTMIGCISNKHGHFMSIYTDGAVVAHDWTKVQMQLGPNQRDGFLFYANRCEIVKAGVPSDLQFSRNSSYPAFYLGKDTKNVYLPSIERLCYVEDHGSNNTYNIYSLNDKDQQNLLAKSWINLLEGKTPYGSGLRVNSDSDRSKNIGTILSIEDGISLFSETYKVNEIEGFEYMFDGDPTTYAEIVNTTNNKYGAQMVIAETGIGHLGTSADEWIEIDYMIKGVTPKTYNNSLYVLIGCTGAGTALAGLSSYSRLLSFDNNYDNVGAQIRKIYLPLGTGSKNINIAFIVTKELENLILQVHGIKYWTNRISPEYSTYEHHKNAPKKYSFVNTDEDVYVNLGDSANKDLRIIETARKSFEITLRTKGNGEAVLRLSSCSFGLGEFEYINYSDDILIRTTSNARLDSKFSFDYKEFKISKSDGISGTFYYHRIRISNVEKVELSGFYGNLSNLAKSVNDISLTSSGAFGVLLCDNQDITDYIKNIKSLYVDAEKSDNVLINIGRLDRVNIINIKNTFKVYGNLGLLPYTAHSITLNNCDVSEITYNKVPNIKTFPEQFSSINITGNCSSLTTDMVDSLLIDLSECVKTAINSKLIKIPSERSSSSDEAVAKLEEIGFTVNVPLKEE